MQENEKSIILKRSIKNICLHTMLSGCCATFFIFLTVISIDFYKIFIFWPILFLIAFLGILMAFNVVSIWTFRIEINKHTKILTFRRHLTKNKYSLGGGLWVKMPGALPSDDAKIWHMSFGASVYYDNHFLFDLPYDSEAYQRVLEYLKETGVSIKWSK